MGLWQLHKGLFNDLLKNSDKSYAIFFVTHFGGDVQQD